MAHAAVSAATFWGDFFLALGSALVLFSLSKNVLTERWAEWMTFFAAVSLLIGAMITTAPDLKGYEARHHAQGALAFVVLIGVVAFVLASLLRSALGKRVPDEDGEAYEHKDTKVGQPEREGEEVEEEGDAVESP
jgi:hypothetical protein